jgi:hypothetical protein
MLKLIIQKKMYIKITKTRYYTIHTYQHNTKKSLKPNFKSKKTFFSALPLLINAFDD